MANVANSCFRSGYASQKQQERTHAVDRTRTVERDGTITVWWCIRASRMRREPVVQVLAAPCALGGSNLCSAGDTRTLSVLPSQLSAWCDCCVLCMCCLV